LWQQTLSDRFLELRTLWQQTVRACDPIKEVSLVQEPLKAQDTPPHANVLWAGSVNATKAPSYLVQ